MAGRVYDYGRPRATAQKLVGRFGRPVEIRIRNNGPRYSASIVFEDYKTAAIDGSRIKIGDYKGLIPAASLVPLNGAPPLAEPLGDGDQLFWGGKIRQIKDSSILQPGPDPILYTVQIRGPR